MSPEDLAAWLTDHAAEAHRNAMDRYPYDREERLADEAAQLRLLIEIAAGHLQAMEFDSGANPEDPDRVRDRGIADEMGAL